MSTHGNEPFLFDMHEQITFRQGEEIDDLYGISIQPDVNIIQESTYIQLRGVLMVSGDYQSLPREEPMYYMDDQEDEENYVQQVKALDNGFTTFQYPIPVDITIPRNRVTETGEPDVEIEYFDYELPEPKSLHVYAKIRLANVEMFEEEEVRSDEEEVSPDFQLQEVPSFEDEEEENETYGEAGENESQDDSKGREFWQKEQSQSINEFFNKKAKEEAKAKEEKPKKEAKKEPKKETKPEMKKEAQKPAEENENQQPEVEMKKKDKKKDKKKKDKAKEEYKEEDNTELSPEYEKDNMDDNEEYEGEESNKKPKKKMLGLNYLSNFFRDDEEPERVRVKMRFVQENETLDSIADSYQVSVAQLERLNGLESNNHLKAGDVLYVPFKKQSH